MKRDLRLEVDVISGRREDAFHCWISKPRDLPYGNFDGSLSRSLSLCMFVQYKLLFPKIEKKKKLIETKTKNVMNFNSRLTR